MRVAYFVIRSRKLLNLFPPDVARNCLRMRARPWPPTLVGDDLIKATEFQRVFAREFYGFLGVPATVAVAMMLIDAAVDLRRLAR